MTAPSWPYAFCCGALRWFARRTPGLSGGQRTFRHVPQRVPRGRSDVVCDRFLAGGMAPPGAT
eukprot:5748035-Lingulodinium_polyedra.AAC.1